ncbi:MAG: [protein-PII] uridylyltransferase [Verrucomicrobia bacterium]|nr:MAG: [protein-PII] uridylyltransferase [Verrucomicrobiota bacterium]PYK90776.1 MAG: [protein-PII] uridylyltransferase [Verrucomicrobiota bacterium]
MATSRHLEKVLAHAEDQLALAGKRRPTEVLSTYKKFLKLEEHRLRLKHQAGGGGREICARRGELVDVILRHVFAAAANAVGQSETSLALIALGGYGRGELNPFSDVDVMLLHGDAAGKVSPYIEEMAEQILYLLWDIGFKVGHSTRSMKEALAQANHDMLTKTAMLESRFLAGDRVLAREFRNQFRTKCVIGSEREYVELRMRDQEARHRKFGDSVYMQEPNLKNGCGGLRDYQNLLWMSYFKEGALTTTHLVGEDWLSESDQRRIEMAYDFLLRLRTDLHYLSKRAADILHLNLQEEIARRLRYREKNGQRATEALMRDYYKHTRNIFRVTERITEQFATGYATSGTRALFSFLPLRRGTEIRVGSFFVRHGQLHTERRDLFKTDPLEMMTAFQRAQEHNIDLSPELEDLLSRALGQITRTYRYAKAPREIFKAILSKKGEVGRALRLMHRIDFLGRYVPEFGKLTCLVQHEFFHRYTADEHTLLCIDKLDALMRTNDPKLIPYRRLFENLEEPFVLYLALLLHDTGRAVGARPHSEASALFAQSVAKRLQLSPEQRKSLILLVDHHVTLSSIAQQRNLDDPATIAEFAKVVRNQKNLHALMLLTLADGQGTTGQSWSDWKESLVWQLFQATSQYLADQKSYQEQTKIERESLEAAAAAELPSDFADEIEAHFEFMPDNYFRASDVAEIVQHLNLFRSFFENTSTQLDRPLVPAVNWEAFPQFGHSIASFCTWDRLHLLAKIAGSFSVVPLNILSADIFPREDHAILAVFRVCDTKGQAVTEGQDRAQVENTLRHALEVEIFEFASLLEEARHKIQHRRLEELEFPAGIAIDNKAHPTYTLVQIEAPDRVGLLYDLLTALEQEGTNIVLSRISTQKGAAIDTFYITDSSSRAKITDSHRMAALQRRLRSAIMGGPAH